MFRQKARLAGVIRVHMGADDALDWFATEFIGDDLQPQFAGGGAANARVNHIPAVVIFQQIQVDMVQ